MVVADEDITRRSVTRRDETTLGRDETGRALVRVVARRALMHACDTKYTEETRLSSILIREFPHYQSLYNNTMMHNI